MSYFPINKLLNISFIFIPLLLLSCVESNKKVEKLEEKKSSSEVELTLNDQYIGYHYGYDLEDRFGDKLIIRGNPVHIPLIKYQFLIEQDSVVFLKQTNMEDNSSYNYEGKLIKMVDSTSNHAVYSFALMTSDRSSNQTGTLVFNLENKSIFCKEKSSPLEFSLFRKKDNKEFDNLAYSGVNYTYFVQNFISLIENDKKEALSKLFKGYNDNIKNQTDFIEQYDSIIDSEIQFKITSSNIEKDWSTLGWRGIFGADVYLDYEGNILRLPESKSIKQTKENTTVFEKERLHESISDFSMHIFSFKTRKFIVRIDQLADESFRYTSWSADQTLDEKPSLILYHGERIFEGSGGNNYLQFKNGHILYLTRENRLRDENTSPFMLEVYQKEALIVEQVGEPYK